MILTVTLNPAVDKALEVPDFRVGVHARAVVRAVLPAGKGVNVARGVARLGGGAMAAGLVGRAEEAMFAESLAAEGVETAFVAVGGRTRTNTTVLDPVRHTSTHLRERGFSVDRDEVAVLRDLLLDRLRDMEDGAPVVFAGSLPDGVGPQDLARLVRACAERGARVVVDTNGLPLRAAVETRALEAIKPNLEELGECLGRPVPRDGAPEAAAGLVGKVRSVLLTLGAEGACLIREGLRIGRRCPVDPSEVVNTVGCGDAFLAGWLRGRELGDETEALGLAVAAGAASAMSETTVGYSLEDVQGLLPRCEPLAP